MAASEPTIKGLTIFQNQHMQGHFFSPKNTIKPQPELSPLVDKEPPLSYNGDQYCSDSLNELNVAFIAEESKLMLSDSQSVVSEGLSISGISNIRSNSRVSSPLINFKLEEEFSGLEDWSVEHNISFAKPNLKRPNPSIDEEENQEEIDNRCTKRKMNEKMKVLTINPALKNPEKASTQSGYMLRSRAKANNASQSSSNEQLREMINDIEEQQIGSSHYKNKLRMR